MKRVYSIDFIKFFAAFAVVVIHAHSFEQVPILGWDGETVNLFFESLARFAVPFFFMASGFFFGKKVENQKMNDSIFRKQISRMFQLYFKWTFFYLLYDLFFLILAQWEDKKTIGTAVYQYFKENWTFATVFYYGNPTGARHLWFLTALIWSLVIVYLFTCVKKINWLLLGSLFLNLLGVFDAVKGLPTRETIFMGLFYTASGCWIALHEQNMKKLIPPKWALLLIPLLGGIQVIERFLFFKGDYYLSTIPLTWLLLIIALQFPAIGKNREITHIGADSVHIYLLHWFYIKVAYRLLDRFGGIRYTETILWGLFFPIFIFSISYYTFHLLSTLKRKRMIP